MCSKKKVLFSTVAMSALMLMATSCADDQTSDLTLNDLIDLRLSGYPESQALRKQLANSLHIQESNAKSFLKQCQFKHLTKDDLEKKLITCKNP